MSSDERRAHLVRVEVMVEVKKWLRLAARSAVGMGCGPWSVLGRCTSIGRHCGSLAAWIGFMCRSCAGLGSGGREIGSKNCAHDSRSDLVVCGNVWLLGHACLGEHAIHEVQLILEAAGEVL